MDINKIFPKPRQVEEELKKKKEDDDKKAEAEELARIKALAPPVAAPKMSQLIEEPLLIFKRFYILFSIYFSFICNFSFAFEDCERFISRLKSVVIQLTCPSPIPSSPIRSLMKK